MLIMKHSILPRINLYEKYISLGAAVLGGLMQLSTRCFICEMGEYFDEFFEVEVIEDLMVIFITLYFSNFLGFRFQNR